MKRMALICEVLSPPLDEGVRILAARLAREISRRADLLVIGARKAEVFGIEVRGLLHDRWFLGRDLAEALRSWEPEGILYVPWTSLTARTLVRVAVLRRRAPRARLGVMALQPRGAGRLIRLAAWVGRPDLLFALGPKVEADGRSLGLPVCRLEGGVDTDLFRPRGAESTSDLRRALGLPLSAYMVLHVGHLTRGRGIMALASVQALDGVQAVLVASTSTERDPELRRRLQAAGVRVIESYLPAIEDYYRAADCYLFPVESSVDSIELPLSVLEAMACNLPIVTTRFGGLPELLEGGGPGVRFVGSREEIPRQVAALQRDRPAPEVRDRALPLGWDSMAERILAALDTPEHGVSGGGP